MVSVLEELVTLTNCKTLEIGAHYCQWGGLSFLSITFAQS